MILVPEGAEAPVASNQLTINEAKKVEMVAKAKDLMGGKAVEAGKLMNLLEQEYIKNNEHYTSKQLKTIIEQVQVDLAPVEITEVV